MTKKDRFGLVGNTIASTFRVDEVVAEGGFGVVYRAFHLHFRSPVALKCLKIPDELSPEERTAFLEQFRSEAEVMFRLSSSLPNIVRPLHVDAVHAPEGQFVPLMALEWLDGKSFEKLLEQRTFRGEEPMSLDELVPLLTPAALALDQAHAFAFGEETLTVIHRDIKPDNLFLCQYGGEPMVKILDFGISKVRRLAGELPGQASRTDGQAPFSPAYGAPEQWVPKRYGPTGPWTDVWGLALTIVEILKGDAVIVGDHAAMMGTALDPKVRPTPRAEGVDISDEVEQVFQKALALDPRYRYRTMRDFWDALRASMHYGGAKSQSKIRVEASGVELPPMSAPTPWTAPGTPGDERRTGAGAPLESATGLPPMLAPALLEPSTASELSVEALFPHRPGETSRSAPAPSSHEIPVELEVEPLDERRRSRSEARPTDPLLRAAQAPLELELEPTTLPPPPPSRPFGLDFPPAPRVSEEKPPLTLVPSAAPKQGRKLPQR